MTPDQGRIAVRQAGGASPAKRLADLEALASLSVADRAAIATHAADLVRQVRSADRPGLTEAFLAQFGLSTTEGVALMCLAEALLRVPDTETIDALIEDKIAPSDWGRHLGQSSSSLVNASTWALLLTGKVLDTGEGIAGILRAAVRRLGEPVIRRAVQRAMRELGSQFVLGQTIAEALENSAPLRKQGYTYSYDMLGEAARTDADARRYHLAYSDAISALARQCESADIRENPGISVKLSALHPRYETGQHRRVMQELVPRALSLSLLAKSAGMGFNIDAEEADRLELSLDVIEALIASPALAGWNGLGVVVQAYGLRASAVIDWLHALATKHDRRIMVRLVKGAYWDTEVKRAQVLGLPAYPVFTAKTATDISYIANARKLLGMTGRIYPQFATHNAHSVAAVLHMAKGARDFEFQRLHGMGESLHDAVHRAENTRCRIYAPVGTHSDLLAYLVRRLLENGANSSFVNQIVDTSVPAEAVAADPFATPQTADIPLPADLFVPRRNSAGHDLNDQDALDRLDTMRDPFRDHKWQTAPLIASRSAGGKAVTTVNPSDPDDVTGKVREATPAQIDAALDGAAIWDAPVSTRARVLRQAADGLETNRGEIHALLAREAGKTLPDCEAELREAVDFLRYYAVEAERLKPQPRGVFACIAPWNFPLAIFTGQIAAALAAGNAVIAKPAPQTPHMAHLAVKLLHKAGVPATALQLLPGGGAVGAALTGDRRLSGVAFTGSTATALAINRAMAETGRPDAVLIAETGGINAMIVDSTALPEQAVRDILASAFQSAGQRCSALRLLCLQGDIAPRFLEMMTGAMEELRVGDPWLRETDVGPVIDAAARARILAHVAKARTEGRVIARLETPETGHFVAPTLIRIDQPADLTEEIFGPVLHVTTFGATQTDEVADAINASGYGLTFGLHTRIDGRVQHLVERVRAGNIYVNRNQIGAVVGSQPFGGEGLSGTGPKAGGPDYLPMFAAARAPRGPVVSGRQVGRGEVQEAIDDLTRDLPATETLDLPGPTGETNRLSRLPRGVVLCLGPNAASAFAQADEARQAGCPVVVIAPGIVPAASPDRAQINGYLPPESLTSLQGFAAVALWAEDGAVRAYRRALAARDGAILPLVTTQGTPARYRVERHLCVDTTAAGGNAALMSGT